MSMSMLNNEEKATLAEKVTELLQDHADKARWNNDGTMNCTWLTEQCEFTVRKDDRDELYPDVRRDDGSGGEPPPAPDLPSEQQPSPLEEDSPPSTGDGNSPPPEPEAEPNPGISKQAATLASELGCREIKDDELAAWVRDQQQAGRLMHRTGVSAEAAIQSALDEGCNDSSMAVASVPGRKPAFQVMAKPKAAA